MDEYKTQHLEFIQNNIARMNTNSFHIKGLEISVVSTFYAIYASTSNDYLIFFGIIPTFLFWLLDTYYSLLERKFRGIYDVVAGIKEDVVIKPYEMPLHLFNEGKYSFWATFWSKTIAWFYGMIALPLLLIGLLLK